MKCLFREPISQLSRVLRNDCGPPYCFLEETGTNFNVSGIGEESLLAGAIRKPEYEKAINVMLVLGLQGSSHLEVESESASGRFEQRRNRFAIVSVLLAIHNK